MDTSQIMGAVALIVSIGGVIVGIINRKRIRSNCCGKIAEASLEITTITPKNEPKVLTTIIGNERKDLRIDAP